MTDISTSVVRKDHHEKTSGLVEYISDKEFQDCYYGKVVRSTIAHGKVIEIKLPNIPEGYTTVTADDIPGMVGLKVIDSIQPIFASEEVRYLGESVLMICGPDKAEVERFSKEVEVVYEELPAILSLDESVEDAVAYSYKKGEDMENVLQMRL